MILKKYIISLGLLFTSKIIFGQVLLSDTIAIEEVSITANRLHNFTVGSKIQKIESTLLKEFQSEPLNDVLSRITPLNINAYGASGLTTASLRGTGTGHTAILWNGFNLQSPLNGSIDISKIPIDFIDDIQVQYGGSGSLFGSGAIGGVIHLNNELDFNKGINFSLNQSMGSFSNYYTGAKFNVSKQKSVISVRLYGHTAKNNFKYINTQEINDFEATQINAGINHYGILISNSLKLQSNKTITTNVWYQDLFNEIQPTINVNKSTANSTDNNLRISSIWKVNNTKNQYFVRIAYINENYRYNNPEYNIKSLLHAKSINSEIENRFIISQNHQINIGLTELYEIGESNNYNNIISRNRASLFLSYKYYGSANKLSGVVSLRSELIDHDFAPLTPSIGLRYYFFRYFSFNSTISKIYKLPTFNDLYWSEWGNPNLKPENGWSTDAGLNFEKKFEHNKILINSTLFNNNIYNWIIWTPSLSTWHPENVTKVWSRGIETSLSYEYSYSWGKTGICILYSYTKATNQNSENQFIKEYEKQLIYTPLNKGNISFYSSFHGFFIRYTHQFVGKRYTTKDNSYFVDSYHIGDFSVGKVFELYKNEFILNIKINNLWNNNYQVMINYAMPMVNYQISLSYHFNKSN